VAGRDGRARLPHLRRAPLPRDGHHHPVRPLDDGAPLRGRLGVADGGRAATTLPVGEEPDLTPMEPVPPQDHVIRFDDVTVSFPTDDGKRRVVLNNLDLHVRRGELVTLVGPSGCGKSTLLRLILGADRPTAGTVRVNGEMVSGLSRDRGIVFQQYSLFPHLRVFENVSIGPVLEQTSLIERYLLLPSFFRKRRVARARAREYVARIGFEAGDADKFPYELSGGMRQRVAIAQAMIMEP